MIRCYLFAHFKWTDQTLLIIECTVQVSDTTEDAQDYAAGNIKTNIVNNFLFYSYFCEVHHFRINYGKGFTLYNHSFFAYIFPDISFRSNDVKRK